MSRADAIWAAAAISFLGGWLLLAWPWLSGQVTIPWDAKAHFQPQAQFLAGSLARGDSPFWNPYAFSGYPQVADPQSLIFSPPFLLLALFTRAPSLWAVDATVLVAIAAGGLALIAWFKDRGWHPGGALLCALAFAFGAAMSWRLQHTGQVLSLVYLAIVLFLLDRALRQSNWRYGLGAGVVAAFMVLGRDQVGLLGTYLLIGYVVWYWLDGDGEDRIRRSLLPLLAGGVAGVLLIALPLMMTLLVAEASNRPQISFEGAGAGSLHPALLLTWLIPDLFGASGHMRDYWGPPSFAWKDTGLFVAQNMGVIYLGAIPALLVFWGLCAGRLFAREIRFFTGALAVAVIYALGWYTPVFAAFHAFLPGVDLFRRPADAVFIIGFLGAILAGYAAHRAWEHDATDLVGQRGWLICAGVAVAVLITGAVLSWSFDRLELAARPLITSALLMAGAGGVIFLSRWLQPIRPVISAGLLAAFTVGDLATTNGPNTSNALPTAHYDVLSPNTENETVATLHRLVAEGLSKTRRDRVELVGLGFHWPNASLTHELENTLGYNPVRLAIYEQATGAGDSSGLPDQRRFSEIMPSYNSTMADLLGLRFVASGVEIEQIDPKLKVGDLNLVARTKDAFIYENPSALPRVLYATESYRDNFDKWPEIARSGLSLGFHLSGLKFERSVLLHDEKQSGRIWPTYPPGLPGPARSARIESYANTEVVIVADGPGGYVVLNDVWHPWWVAQVDGQPAKVERANYLFRAVAVPPGRHTVRFKFAPISGALQAFWARAFSQDEPK
ncbi:MAG: hypothetical protein K0U74_15525 [Alphaproteobacteria bacterium]|nr:hypothetical protein [Alphaproteobacteria bacterium]